MIENMLYNRCESIELMGLGKVVNKLEVTIVSILEDIGVGKVELWQVNVYRQLKNSNKTIIHFVRRKNTALALHNRKK